MLFFPLRKSCNDTTGGESQSFPMVVCSVEMFSLKMRLAAVALVNLAVENNNAKVKQRRIPMSFIAYENPM